MTDCGCELEAEGDAQRATLRVVLAINAAMFVVEIVSGVLASSTGLIADSLDMLADASVYAISLYAVGRAANMRGVGLGGEGTFVHWSACRIPPVGCAESRKVTSPLLRWLGGVMTLPQREGLGSTAEPSLTEEAERG